MASIPRLFTDGIQALNNMLANRRNAQVNNRIKSGRVDWDELRAIYRSGMGSKIIRLKSGIALNDTLQFESEADKEFYRARLEKHVKKAAKFQLAFGRALAIIHEPGADLSQPIGTVSDWSKVRYHVFSGDMVYVQSVNLDLASANYYQPTAYSVRGFTIHPSRVVDFRYVEPVEMDAPEYFYGGISEFELIRNELVSDQVVQRAVPAILEKSSTLFYKVKGFKDLLADKQETTLVTYFTELENLRSIYGAGIVDQQDEIEVHSQALANLAESDMITLRRLAMVTGLPLSWLVGEAARGLNSTGEGERQVLKQTIESYQSEYLLANINRLMALHGCGEVQFKDGLLETDIDRMDMQTKAIDNALKLWQMGEDYKAYLEDHSVVTPDDFAKFFAEEEDPVDPPSEVNLQALLGGGNEA
jgi:hypothetical protein